MSQPLDNIFWHSLSGAHACYATGAGNARRYAPGFSPILGFEDAVHPDFNALLPYCDRGEHFYCADSQGPLPEEWQIHVEKTMYRMHWDGAMPADVSDDKDEHFVLRALNQSDAEQALELAILTNPGPFGLRTIELGEYLGYFIRERLVAMAGERSYAPPFREVSGVCTHPDFQGQGLARRLMHKVIRRQLLAKEIPFLHVMSHNTAAHELYLRMGFKDYCETGVRVVSRV
nr:GNAT family N-acetyltransferase [uncultured Undibacterium sp.]